MHNEVASGPNVVEDGLVLALDAGNTKSYPGSGSTWTDTVGSNNGTLTNGPTFSRDNGGYITFDGTNDYVTISDTSDFSFGSGEFAIEAWFRPDSSATVSASSYHTILICGVPVQLYWINNQFQFFASTSNSSPPSYFIAGNTGFNSGSNSAARGVWHHIVVTRTGNDFKMYLNGTLVKSESNTSSFGDPNIDTTIGATNTAGLANFAYGRISNVKIYKGKGLTAAEILQNYNATKNRYNFVWSLPETTTGTVFDFTGGSLPSGMYQDSDGPTVTWGANSVELAGDAPNDGASYPLRVATSFTGDYLFQLSTRIDLDPGGATQWCSDAGIGLFNTAYNTSDWNWKWGILSGRIAAQNNCDTPHLYGHTNDTSMSGPNNGDVLLSSYVA